MELLKTKMNLPSPQVTSRALVSKFILKFFFHVQIERFVIIGTGATASEVMLLLPQCRLKFEERVFDIATV
jgi:hypothetical protein